MAEVLIILQDQIRRYGGAYGLRDPALLSSAMAMPTASFEGKLLHSDLYEQAAAYAFHISQNHPFVDGNKRTGLASALAFLDMNGIELDDPEQELYSLMMELAAGTRKKPELAAAFRRLKKSKRKQRRSR